MAWCGSVDDSSRRGDGEMPPVEVAADDLWAYNEFLVKQHLFGEERRGHEHYGSSPQGLG